MFRRMKEIYNKIQAIVTNILEQLNIDFSITLFARGCKPDIVIEYEMYVIDITVKYV